jgi:hypothetical protein
MARTIVSLGLFAFGLLAPVLCRAQPPENPPVNKASLEAALRVTRAAAAEYEIEVGEASPARLELKREPVFRWSNPVVGDIHGNVFVWTRGARPLAVGSFFHYFSARPTMEHEFHSLAEAPLAATFHGERVWATKEAGVAFAKIADAPEPAPSQSQRSLQLKQLAKGFTGRGVFGKNSTEQELRLLPQPLYRYEAPDEGILTGGLFAFVRATDPEILLLIEARNGKKAADWHFAAARMHSIAELSLYLRDEPIWHATPLPLKELFEKHERPYTAFKFRKIPEFLQSKMEE